MNRTQKKRKTKRLGKLRMSKSLRDFLPPVSRISVIVPSNWQKEVADEKARKPVNGVSRRSN